MRLATWIVSCLLSLSALPTLAANVHNPLSSADIRQNGFIYCASGSLSTFNPQIASSGIIVDTLSEQLYDRLLGVDPYTYRLVPELAVSWEVLDGGASYIFHLRRNISFQTTPWFTPERKMNADDVVFSFQRIFNPENPWHPINGGAYPYFDSLGFNQTRVTVTKLDDYRVKFTLPQPDASFLWHLATRYAPVLSAEYAAKLVKENKMMQIDQLPVGTGPYALHTWHPGQYVRLFRNDAYWTGVPHMQQAVIDLGVSGAGRIAKLLTGECDVLAWPAASQLTLLRNDYRLQLSQRSGMNIAYLAFNTRRAPLNDLRVRQAIALSINNPRLMQSIYYGSAETAATMLPPASWAHDIAAQVTEYNPDKARRLLKKAGAEHLQLTMWVPTASRVYNPSPLKMAELLQADLAQVGITVTIIPIEGRFQTEQLKSMQQDLTLTGWTSDSNDPDSFLRPLLSCAAIKSHTNYAQWCLPEFDQLLDKALRS
ncbi:MAG: ABC transporter substrate-binding protein SapA, partial [Enterobacteriaceae bacterium]